MRTGGRQKNWPETAHARAKASKPSLGLTNSSYWLVKSRSLGAGGLGNARTRRLLGPRIKSAAFGAYRGLFRPAISRRRRVAELSGKNAAVHAKPAMRPPNEIDFWRGLALAVIFIDHVPGIVFEGYTLRVVAVSDAAEIFVFLAGWSLRLLVASRQVRDMSASHVVLRLESRAFTIFAAQIVITEIALAMTAAGAIYLENPLVLDWNNASAVFENPMEAHVGLVLLSHQLGYFDILPLYVVLMAGAPIAVLLDRRAPALVLPLSLAIYAATLATGANLPTWPVEGRWYFNPGAWQLNFTLGFMLAAKSGLGGYVRRHRLAVRLAGIPVLLAGLVAAHFGWSPDPLSLPEPRLFLMFDKTYATPARVLGLLSIVAVFGGCYKGFEPWAGPVTRFFSTMGRNSLNVFCVGSLLSLMAQFARFSLGGGVVIDTLVLISAVACMYVTAWLSEWRERAKA